MVGSLNHNFTKKSWKTDLNDFVPSPDWSCESQNPREQIAGQTVNAIVHDLFDDRVGLVDANPSCCAVEPLQPRRSKYNFDDRLRYWKSYLEERRRTSARICQETGKLPKEVLCVGTLDEPEKHTVKSVMDYAERLQPLVLSKKVPAKLKGYTDPCTCEGIAELQETLPKAERDQRKTVEIVGMPKAIKAEQLGCDAASAGGRTRWLDSTVLEQRIGDQQQNIQNIIDHFPDIDGLHVVGESYEKLAGIPRDPQIEALPEENIQDISSDASLCECDFTEYAGASKFTLPEYGLKINDEVFRFQRKRGSKIVQVEERFVCEPCAVVVKQVLHVENLGKRVLTFEWLKRPYYNTRPDLLDAFDDEFAFDDSSFRLNLGESRSIVVQFQPRKLDRVKARWLLKVDPPFFFRRINPAVLELDGRCTPAPEYVDKLDEVLRNVIAKSNLRSLRTMSTNLISLMPLITSDEIFCPYQRVLNDCEIFELENPGIKCERYHDLVLLKDIYKRVKKPREPNWDLKLDTLKEMILNIKEPAERALLFSEITGIVQEMRGEAVPLEEKLDDVGEREHARLLLVRGVISTGIEDWESLAAKVEEAFLAPMVGRFCEDTLKVQEEYAEEHGDQLDNDFAPLEVDDILKTVLPEVRRNKALRDTLYVQTYSHLCCVVESIVSAIEGTDDA